MHERAESLAAMEHTPELVRVANLYYYENLTMEAIAADLEVSRSTVSRMLKTARDEGIVTVTITSNPERSELGALLADRFGVELTSAAVSRSASDLECLSAATRAAATLIRERMTNGKVLGIAWGTTTSEIGRSLASKRLRSTSVVQLNGAGNTAATGIAYASDIISRFAEAFDAAPVHFPVPAFFDFAETRRAMWRERSITKVLDLQAQTDIAVFSVGAVAGGVPSRVYASGYLEAEDFHVLDRAGVVGDVCTVFLRADGSYADVPLNDRASGPTPDALRLIPMRICCVSGVNKVGAIIAALHAGVATDLVIDETTASALFRRLRQ